MRDIIGHGGGKGGGSSHTHYEAQDSLHSTSFARVLDLVSEGEILGLAEGLQSIYLNETPIQNADGTSNFQGVTVDFRTGTQTQDYIAGFPDVENETSVGVELKYGAPWVRAINNIELSAVRITLGVDQLYKADTDNGDIGGTIVNYQIELSTDGGAYQMALQGAFNGKTMSAYQRSARIDLPHATRGWQIRVTRLTANSTVVSVVDKTNIISYTEVIDAKLRYPMSAIVGIQVDAKQFQSVPTRAFDMFGRIIQVPSNYDPRTRAYTGTWDGTFKPAWSDNPAWVFRDLVLNDRYGLGNRITAAQLDKWALYKIARYCDELVPDGKGGTEPRFTCNLYLQTRKQAYAVLQDIASIFRGISYWGAGTIMASADMPSDPVYVYTAANVIGGKFTRTGTKKSTRYTVALVTWNDPADGYKPKTSYVEGHPDSIRRYGIQPVELTAFGCTSEGQAQRVGRWACATSYLETEGISFDVGMDGAIALPGQVVRIADPSRMGRRVGGRVRAVAGRVVTLDKAPTIKPGDRLTVIMPSGASETRTVAAVAGDSVTVDSDWSTAPRATAVWSVDSDELSAPLFRVLSVAEKDAVTFTITAVQHEPGKYDFVEHGTAITPRSQTALDVTRQAPPASVTLAGYTVSLADVQKLALQVSCAAVAGAVAYEGAYRRGNDNWVAIPRQASPTMDVLDVLPGTYTATMAAVNAIGVTSIETMSVAVEIAADGVSKSAALLLDADARSFHTNQAGETDPAVINIEATLIALVGPVTWSITGAKLTNTTATTAQLKFADMSAAAAEVTVSVTAFGRTYSKSIRITQSQDGAVGADGLKTATARLFQWAPVAPARPKGKSVFDWPHLANTGYTGTDGWANPAPANPGTPGWHLFSASVPIAAAAAAETSPVDYANAIIEDGAQNGAAGVSGLQSRPLTVYRWDVTIPAGPTGPGTLKWADGSFGAVPAGWSLVAVAPSSLGMTQFAATVQVVDTAGKATTDFNWQSASVMVVGYVGTNGAPGQQGASYVTAYCATTVGTGTSAPAPTKGRTSLPAANSGGLNGSYSANVPTLAAGQYQMQSDGIYDPSTDYITWSIPYQSSLKVATLAAITANLGAINGGSINLGNGTFTVDNSGNLICYSIKIIDPNTGKTVFQAGGKFNPEFLPNEALNSQLVPSIQAAATTSTWTGTSGRPSDDAIRNNLVDLSSWVRLGGMPWRTNGEFNVLGNSLADYGIQGPKGWDDVVWYAEERGLSGVDGDNPGGGWNDAPLNLDPDKKYRFVLPVHRATGTGWSYWGLSGIAQLNTTTPQDNPYFASSNALVPGRWYLFVGYVFPAGSNGNTHDSAGIWDCATGEKVAPGQNYNFLPGVGNIVHRAYQYYASMNAVQLLGRPMVNLVDGTEPGLREYFASAALLNNRVTLGEDGALRGAGGGQVSLHGMGQDTLRVVAASNPAVQQNRNPTSPGFYINGGKYRDSIRSYNLIVIRRSDKAIVWERSYDVYGAGEITGYTAGHLAADLNVYADADHAGKFIVILWTHDEPYQRRTENGLPDAIYRNGGSREIFGSPQFQQWSAYVLVAISGCGEGGAAIERYRGDYSADPNAWLDISFSLLNGDLVGTGASYAKALTDKLSQTTGGVMRAQVTMQTSGAIVAGNASYNSVGYGGTGTVMSPYGFACIQNGVPKMAMSVSGDIFYGGELRGAYGTFGNLRVASGGAICSGPFYGAWSWNGPNAAGGFQISEQGILGGNRDNPNIGYFQVNFLTGEVYMPGFQVVNRQITLDRAIILNPVLTPFNVGITNSVNQYSYTLYRLSTDAYAGLYIATVDSGNDGATFNWSVSGSWPCWLVQDSSANRVQLHINMKGGAPLSGDSGDFYIKCSVTKGGNTVATQQIVTVTAS